jgi:putative endopeptidase
MRRRRLALVVMAACSAKPAAPTTGPDPATAEGTAGASSSRTASASGSAGTGAAAAPAPPPSSRPAGPASTATLAEVGLEAASLDRSVDPCVDFYQFACGGWLASNPIPADRAHWGRVGELDDRNKAAIRTILETTTGKLGDYYASCMDEAAIDRAGLAGIKPLLDRTLKIKDAKSWLAALAELHRVRVPVVFETTVAPDPKSPTTNIDYLDTGKLGLPDRDHYVKSGFEEQVDAYRQHVARMLALAGVAKPDAAARDVLAIETELAKLTKTATEKRDIETSHDPTDLKQLARRTKSIDWKGYFKALGAAPSAKLVVGAPKLFAGLDGVRKRFKPAQWSGYFTYHLLVATAFALPKGFDDEVFALHQLVTGVAEKPPRFKRCIESTGHALGELLGRAYVDKQVSPDAKQTASALVDTIAAAMHDEIDKLDWMSEPTKKAARGKLAKLVRMIGYPERWRSYDFEVKRDDFAGNALRAAAFETRRVLGKVGTAVDRSEWLMNAFAVEAHYNPASNSLTLPAGLLQPPFFGAKRPIAANLGGIGMIIGHELTHAFDDRGAQLDADGNRHRWWQPEDQARFDERGSCVARMYDSFEALPKQYVDGQRTARENIADLGGVKVAFRAYRALRKDAQRAVVADGFTEDQQFFLAVGQAWCSKYRPAEAQRRLAVDPHAPPKFRVFGALRNLPELSQAFGCAPGTPMHPEQTCSVW